MKRTLKRGLKQCLKLSKGKRLESASTCEQIPYCAMCALVIGLRRCRYWYPSGGNGAFMMGYFAYVVGQHRSEAGVVKARQYFGNLAAAE